MLWRHHKIPKHAGGTDSPANIEILTTEQHAEAHRKLYEEFGRTEDKIAWHGLAGIVPHEEVVRQFRVHCSTKGGLTRGHKGIRALAAIDPKRANEIAKLGAAANGRSPNNFFHHKSTCPHCGRLGQTLLMKRWHFDNCKEKSHGAEYI